jgi:hypothetical protein
MERILMESVHGGDLVGYHTSHVVRLVESCLSVNSRNSRASVTTTCSLSLFFTFLRSGSSYASIGLFVPDDSFHFLSKHSNFSIYFFNSKEGTFNIFTP